MEGYQIQDIIVIAFYDENIHLASCEVETRIEYARNRKTLADIKLVQLVENTDSDPFNVALCEDIYFDPVAERELTLRLLQTAKAYIEDRTQNFLNPSGATGNRPRQLPFDLAVKYLLRFFIGGGRLSFFVCELHEPQSIPSAQKNIHYNIEVRPNLPC